MQKIFFYYWKMSKIPEVPSSGNTVLCIFSIFAILSRLKLAKVQSKVHSWVLPVFFNFFNNKKWFFAFFSKLIWLRVGFLNRTGGEIGYQLYKKCKKIFFYYWKNLKNTESAQLWSKVHSTHTEWASKHTA